MSFFLVSALIRYQCGFLVFPLRLMRLFGGKSQKDEIS